MKQFIEPGLYVAAVSGGVDSMVLLDVLRQQPGVRLIVAHFDHGIRPDSVEDRKLVQRIAQERGLPFIYDEGHLGEQASEAVARQKRYQFLKKIKTTSGARSIITAHHSDDQLETALLNVWRGTHRKGLSSLQSTDQIVRPLLGAVSKKQIIDYAQANGLTWREDSTNQDLKFRRNLLRHNYLPRLSNLQRQHLAAHLDRAARINQQIDTDLINILHIQPKLDALSRSMFSGLPHDVSTELMTFWLRRNGVADLTRKQLTYIVVAAKTLRPKQSIVVNAKVNLLLTPKLVKLLTR